MTTSIVTNALSELIAVERNIEIIGETMNRILN